MDVLRSLGRRNSQELVDFAEVLNKQGIVSDEDGTWVSSSMVEDWDGQCDSLLHAHGYKGGELRRYAKFFDGYGSIYALYDSVNYSWNDVALYVEAIATKALRESQDDAQ